MTRPRTPTDAGIGPLHHIGIAVHRLGEETDNICAALSGKTAESGVDHALGIKWVWIRSPQNPIFELVAPTGPAGPVARYLEQRGPGLHHVSFEPSSLDRALSHVRECCLTVIGEDRAANGYEQFYIDPRTTGGALFHSFRPL